MITIFSNLFQKIEAEEISPNFFYEASITLMLKPETHYKKENYRPVDSMEREHAIWDSKKKVCYHIKSKGIWIHCGI